MSQNRRKWKPDLVRRINAVRTALANHYGNLYGIKFRGWFMFNGEVAGISHADLRKFEARLAARRNSRGVSASHRARRAREAEGIYTEKPAPLPVRRRRWSRPSPIVDAFEPVRMGWVEKRLSVPVDVRRERQGVPLATQNWLIDRAAKKRARRAGADPDSLTRKQLAGWKAAA